MNKEIFFLNHDQARKNAITAVSAAPTGYIVEVKEPTRTIAQNALLWSCLHDISSQVVWHGRKLAPESWKHLFSASLNGQEAVPNLQGDGFVVLGKSTSKMRVSEMRDLIELIHAFGAEHNVRFSDESARAREWANRFGSAA